MLPLVFLSKIKANKLNIFIVILSGIIIGFNVKFFVSDTLFGHYASSDLSEETSIGLNIIFFALLSIIVEVLRPKNESIEGVVLNNVNLYGIGILFILLLQTDTLLILVIKRVHNYCLLAYIILIPYLISNLRYNLKFKKMINFILAVFFIIIYTHYIVNLGEDKLKIVPYDTYIEF